MWSRLVLMSWLILGAAGCCSAPYKLEDMRSASLRTPYNTVDYFRAAVRLGDWEAVYGMLSPESKAYVDREVGRWAFETFAAGLKYKRLDRKAPPEVAELTVAELIHRSEIVAIRPDDLRSDLWWIQLYYKPIPPDKTRFKLINVARSGEQSRWTVGLLESLNGN